MAAYPRRTIVEYFNGSDWVNISRYVVDDIKGESGFATPSPDDRVASLGTLELTLNNVDNLFTPYGHRDQSTLPGWKKGAKVRVRIDLGHDRVEEVWTGYVADIKSDSGTWGNRRTHVVCVDWIDVATRFPMKGSDILTDQTIDQAIEVLLARLSIQPEGIDLDRGTQLLPAVFSNVKEKTKALSELYKLAMSELGYAYVLKDGTLRVENSSARRGTRGLDKISKHPAIRENLELANGEDFLLVDGSPLLLEEAEEVRLTFTAESLDIETDDDQTLNALYVRAYPVRTDTSLRVVFSLGSPIAIGGGMSIPFSGRYTNLDGGSPISATNLQAPVAGTDYLFNTKPDGTGTNITSDLEVTATYYGDQVDYILRNTGSITGYVIKLQARGYGIYFDTPIEGYISDEDSIEQHGDYSTLLDQRYKRDLSSGVAYARSVVQLMKDPRARVVKASFLANLNHHQLMAFAQLDIGSLISIYENRSGMKKWYYIFSRAFRITLGGIITFTLGCVEAPSINSGGLNPIAVEFRGAGTQDAINFGHLPTVFSNDVTAVTVSAWIYIDELSGTILSFPTNAGGFRFRQLASTPKPGALLLYSNIFNVAPGSWVTAEHVIETGRWIHVAVTYDFSSPDNDPMFYVDGVAKPPVLEHLTPAGTPFPRDGVPLMIGNVKSNTEDYHQPFDGQIKDVRVYNRILAQEEIEELYEAGPYADSVPDGLTFQGIAISSDLGDLDGQEIPEGEKFFDNINRFVGEPHGGPLIRS